MQICTISNNPTFFLLYEQRQHIDFINKYYSQEHGIRPRLNELKEELFKLFPYAMQIKWWDESDEPPSPRQYNRRTYALLQEHTHHPWVLVNYTELRFENATDAVYFKMVYYT